MKGIDNTKANTLSRKAELQDDKKVKGAILRMDEDGKIRYNYL